MEDRFKFKYNVYGTLFDVYAIDFCEKSVCVWVDKVELQGMKLSDYQFDLKNLIQCTGLKDKNGKLIYEGDIIQIPDDYDTYGMFACEKREIYFNEGGFRLKPKWDKNSRGNWLEDTEDFEVIGNIYENPELLEAE